MSNKIMVAAFIAGYAHEPQTRIGGEPYITHPEEVSRILRGFCSNSFDEEVLNELTIAALLHDTVEDQEERLREALANYLASENLDSSPEDYKEVDTFEMLNLAFSGLISRTVKAVTNDAAVDDKSLPYEERLQKYLDGLRQELVESSSIFVFLVKFSDFNHNAGNLSKHMKRLKLRYSSALPIYKESYEKVKDALSEEDQKLVEKAFVEMEQKLA